MDCLHQCVLLFAMTEFFMAMTEENGGLEDGV